MAVAQETRHHTSLQSMEPGLDRPKSALARGVQITEFKESVVNPQPILIEESDLLIEQYLSPTKLRLLTGVDDLSNVGAIEMRVDASETSLGNFGSLLPNLHRLKLSNSHIPHIRDLGSSLRGLHVLWMSRCGLIELDGASSMLQLKELYLSYNEISDITPLSMLDKLQILDLEGNNLEDISQVQYLGMCVELRSLTLEGNPLCVAPAPGEDATDYDYRQSVKKAIPHLKILDEEPLLEGVSSPIKHNVFDDDWAYLEELQRDVSLRESPDDSVASDGSSRPGSGQKPGSRPATGSSSLRPNTAYRPGTALRPSSGFRPMTAGRRPATTTGSVRPASANRPGSAGIGKSSDEKDKLFKLHHKTIKFWQNQFESKKEAINPIDGASDLTLGTVICGNPSKALRARRKLNPDQAEAGVTEEPKFLPQFKHKPEHTYDVLPEEDRDRSEIVEELKTWRIQHEKRMDQIRESKKAQILVVDHDDAVSLSGDESVTDDEEDFDKDFIPLDYSQNIGPEYSPVDKRTYPVPDFSEAVQDHKIPQDLRTRVSEDHETSYSQDFSLYEATGITDGYSDLSSKVLHDFKSKRTENEYTANAYRPPLSDTVKKYTDRQRRKEESNFGEEYRRRASPQRSEIDTQRIRTNSPVRTINTSSRNINDLRSQSPVPSTMEKTGLPTPPTGAPRSRVARNEREIGKYAHMDSAQPVIRNTVAMERPVAPPAQRPSTARAALALPSQPRIRRQLPEVPGLPSKPNVPKS